MTNSKLRLSRRSFLKGAAGTSVALPLLQAGAASAQTTPPKRLVVFFTPNGTIPENWSPDPGESIGDAFITTPQVETNFPLSPILQPLAPHQDDIIVVEGLEQRSTADGPGDGHQKGMGHMLTGTPLQTGDDFTGGNGEPAGWAGGISIDQHVANTIGMETRFKSLELGVQVHGATVWTRMNYAGPGQPLPPENDPAQVFERLFGDLNEDPQELARIRARRRSVLDFVVGDLNALMPRLGAEDRAKVDQHMTAVRALEQRLAAGPLASCQVPTIDAPPDFMANDNFPAVGQLQMDLLVLALACDMTRVASLMWSQSVGNIRFTWEGINEGHHTLSHDTNAPAREKLTTIDTWFASQLAYLIQRMKEVPEGGGTLLDNTAILWCNELGEGASHTRKSIPFVLAGGAGGALNTGRYVYYPGTKDVEILTQSTPHNNLLLTLANAMGLPDTNFGSSQHCTGNLSDLLV
jgi:hypothetical protein